jgi:putative cell wall-binding protein
MLFFTYRDREEKKFMNKIQKLSSIIMAAVLTVGLGINRVYASSTVNVDRYYGDDRYETASSICENGWKTSSQYAVLVNGQNFPDALCAGPLAKKYDAPILLVKKNELTPYTSMELSRLNVKNVFLIGGKGVISQSLEDAIESKGIKVTRISGDTRYDTSIEVAKKLGSTKQIAVVTGENFYDGVSISPIAAMKEMPIILVPKKNFSENTVKFLEGKKKSDAIYVVGGEDEISDDIFEILPDAKRIADDTDVFSRNIDIINEFKTELNTATVYVATDREFSDSLAASPIAAKTNSPIVFVGDYIHDVTSNFFSSEIIANIKILGGSGAISYENESYLKNIPLAVSDDSSYVFTDTIWQNDAYTPRTTVVVNTSAGIKKDVNVTWNISKVKTSNPGKYTLYGKITGTDQEITACLIIKPIPTEIEDIEKEISSGRQYTFPSTVSAKMSDGSTKSVDVKWEYSQQTIKDPGVYTFYGTVERYKKKVKLTLTVY